MKTTTRWLAAGLIATLATVLAACGGGLLGNQGRIRLINATNGLGALDLQVDGATAISGVPPASGSDYFLKKAGTYPLDILQTGSPASLLTTTTSLLTTGGVRSFQVASGATSFFSSSTSVSASVSTPSLSATADTMVTSLVTSCSAKRLT